MVWSSVERFKAVRKQIRAIYMDLKGFTMVKKFRVFYYGLELFSTIKIGLKRFRAL